MSLTFFPEGIYLTCNAPDFLPMTLTFISTSSICLKISLVGTSVNIESIRIETSSSLSSNVRYSTFNPANAQLHPKFAKNKLFPPPLAAAKMFSSPLFIPPNSLSSTLFHPVLT